MLYVEPGSPCGERLVRSRSILRLRDELLDREEFSSPLEARVVSANWRGYDQKRPHSSLNYQTPAGVRPGRARTRMNWACVGR